MPELDKLVNKMAQRNVQKAVLLNDQAMKLFSDEREATGPVVTIRQLEKILSEICPSECLARLEKQGQCQFPYPSPHGLFDITAERSNGALKIEVTARIAPSRTQATLPTGLGISINPATNPSADSIPQVIPSQSKLKKYSLAINFGVLFLIIAIAIPIMGARQRAQEKAKQQAAEQAQSARTGKYLDAIKNLSNIGLQIYEGGEDFVIAREDNNAFKAAITDLENKIKTDNSLAGTETSGDKANLLKTLQDQATENSPYKRAIVINKKAGRYVYEMVSIQGKDALKIGQVCGVIVHFKGAAELGKMSGLSDEELLPYVDKYF